MRTRKQLVRERAQHVQRIQKTLEEANIKFASVASDVTGTSGRAILRALIDGETDPETLLAVTTGSPRADRQTLIESLRGRVRAHHRFLLKLHLEQMEAIEQAIATVDVEVGSHLDPFRGATTRLMTMPGISDVTAQVIVSERGSDMSRFPTAGHLVSWAGLCPRNDESAGKHRSTRVRQGAPWLKVTMARSAHEEQLPAGPILPSQEPPGPKKAIVAVAASMLTSAYHMLRNDADYRDLGPNHFDALDKERSAARLVRRLQTLGYEVALQAA